MIVVTATCLSKTIYGDQSVFTQSGRRRAERVRRLSCEAATELSWSSTRLMRLNTIKESGTYDQSRSQDERYIKIQIVENHIGHQARKNNWDWSGESLQNVVYKTIIINIVFFYNQQLNVLWNTCVFNDRGYHQSSSCLNEYYNINWIIYLNIVFDWTYLEHDD